MGFKFDYVGVVIPESIYIVENKYHQGYVVDKKNNKMLESAINWAKNYHSDFKPIIHEYNNGTFEFELEDAAGGSCQGGRLSFWNCRITAEDGNAFLIGINSDILLNLLKHNTMVNGKLASKIFLGRLKGNAVGAFTENMELFSQAKKDLELKQKLATTKTSKYNAGDVVATLTTTEIYGGEIFELFRIDNTRSPMELDGTWRSYVNPDYNCIVINDEPIKKHVYYYYSNGDETTFNDMTAYSSINSSKPARTVVGHVKLAQNPIAKRLEYFDQQIKRVKEDKNSDRIDQYTLTRNMIDKIIFKIRYSLTPDKKLDNLNVLTEALKNIKLEGTQYYSIRSLLELTERIYTEAEFKQKVENAER